MTFKRWAWVREGSTGWNVRFGIWRTAWQFGAMRHTYKLSTSDRWVFDARFTYDRKERK